MNSRDAMLAPMDGELNAADHAATEAKVTSEDAAYILIFAYQVEDRRAMEMNITNPLDAEYVLKYALEVVDRARLKALARQW